VAVANGDHSELGVGFYDFEAALSDHPITGNTDSKFLGHLNS
jgi:hypothetical protein